VLRTFKTFGIDLSRIVRAFRALPQYYRDLLTFREQSRATGSPFPLGKLNPRLTDRGSIGVGGHYFHQDLHVARRIFENRPTLHVDVGSRVDGFVAHVASFRRIMVMDIRELPDTGHSNIEFVRGDIMNLPEGISDYCDSLSCLHAIEHFGLGRYGDPIAVDGHLRGLETMFRMLQVGGKFYFSVPIGPQRIEFNAHRVFSLDYLLALFRDRFELDDFSYVDDRGLFHRSAVLSDENVVANFGCIYGCGIFEMTKRRSSLSSRMD
jgi:SAM-dependent methyltransferase